MNGNTAGDFAQELPGLMTYTLDRDIMVTMKNNKMTFLVEKAHYPGEYTLVSTNATDVHVMNKQSLTRYIDGDISV